MKLSDDSDQFEALVEQAILARANEAVGDDMSSEEESDIEDTEKKSLHEKPADSVTKKEKRVLRNIEPAASEM